MKISSLLLSVVGSVVVSIGMVGCAGMHNHETKVTMADLPPAVRETLNRETAGGNVTEIEREMKKGRTIYSADATVGGKSWDIAIAEDGSLISKEMEH